MTSSNAAAPEEAFSFEPSVWGEFFINYKPPQLQISEEWMRERADKLKEDVRTLLWTSNDVVARITLVDAIQRLGIGHLFEEEIGNILRDIQASEFTSSSLHEVALRFRLLREHGLWVSPDVFIKFNDDDGRLSNVIAQDPIGLLSLYNAAHLFTHDEPELEASISFARHHLKSMSEGCAFTPTLADQVERALNTALPRTCKRIETLRFMSEYEQEEGHNAMVLELAKLDFNLLQRMHLMELKSISKWWRDFDRYVGLSYVRDRVVESYTWSYFVFHEKHLALTRMIFAKIIQLIVVMDDTYDAHASIQECRQLNTAIQRWDKSSVVILPEYLKRFYTELLSNFKEFEDQVADNEKYRVAYTKKEFQKLSTYYLQEAEWSHQSHKPSFEDQVNLSTMSSAVPLLCVGSTVGMGDAVTKEAFEWAANSTAVIAAAKIGRFLNDIAAIKKRKNKGDVASSVECYMNEHKVTVDIAIAKIESLMEDGWRTLNYARLFEHHGFPVVQLVVNFIAAWVFFYSERKDAYTFTTPIHGIIESLFVKPIPM